MPSSAYKLHCVCSVYQHTHTQSFPCSPQPGGGGEWSFYLQLSCPSVFITLLPLLPLLSLFSERPSPQIDIKLSAAVLNFCKYGATHAQTHTYTHTHTHTRTHTHTKRVQSRLASGLVLLSNFKLRHLPTVSLLLSLVQFSRECSILLLNMPSFPSPPPPPFNCTFSFLGKRHKESVERIKGY